MRKKVYLENCGYDKNVQRFELDMNLDGIENGVEPITTNTVTTNTTNDNQKKYISNETNTLEHIERDEEDLCRQTDMTHR